MLPTGLADGVSVPEIERRASQVSPLQGSTGIAPQLRVAVLVPCYNEAPTIAKVVRDFRAALPDAAIYVYDNNSSDSTSEIARSAGARVRREMLRGKGNVVRRMFADVEADVYLLVDGDDTYPAAEAPKLIDRLLQDGLDLVNGRRTGGSAGCYRHGHQLGNRFLTGAIGCLFGHRLADVLSGYKAFSRRFIKSFPALASGFEIEAELAVHALDLRMPIGEVDIDYRERPPGSTSKLRTYRDGLNILGSIVRLVKEERPLPFFLAVASALAAVSLAIGWSIVLEFIDTGLVPRFPSAILATGLMLVAVLSLMSGLILDTITLGRRETKRLHYLKLPGIQSEACLDGQSDFATLQRTQACDL